MGVGGVRAILASVQKRLAEERAKAPKARDGQKERENMIRALEWIVAQMRVRYGL